LRWKRVKEVKRKRKIFSIEKMRKEVARRGNQNSGEENKEQESSRYRREADGSVEESWKSSLEWPGEERAERDWRLQRNLAAVYRI